MKVLVTGCAGFIGFHLSKKLINQSYKVCGVDNLNDYYDVNIKKNRLKILKKFKNFNFYKIDLVNNKKIKKIFDLNKFDFVVHLAAQAGVRYSITNPRKYLEANIDAFFNIIELSSKKKIKHFIYASSSSVYGDNKIFPLKETNNTDNPISFYGASKKCNEIIANSYSNITNLRCTGLRFFTVYGPYGRPDMSLFKFVSNIIKSKKIDIYNRGNHIRDFTYIDDVVNSIFLLMDKKKHNKIKRHQIFNIASSKPIKLFDFIKIIEKNLNKKAKINLKPFQLGDVHKTFADTNKLYKYINYTPQTKIEEGIKQFCIWYDNYYK